MERIIMHIDVNNAFLSWTAVDLLKKGFKYDIRGSYAAIGGDEDKRRGIIVAKSLPCKKMGIGTADTLYSARKKCPALKVYPADYGLYKRMSDSFFACIQKYSPDIEILSIDECFLDYTKVKSLYGDPVLFAHTLKDTIYENLGFTVNIGIGENKLCAKMASDFEKPNKVHTLWKEEISTKLWPLPVRDLYGVGKKSTEKLKQLGIHTIYDLAQADAPMLYKYFKNNAFHFIKSANGINEEEVITESRNPKGIGNSTTLERDYTKLEDLNKVLLSLSENVVLALQKEGKYAQTISVQIKDKFFKNTSHQQKLTNAVNTTKDVYDISKKLLKELWKGQPIRLIGIRLDRLVEKPSYQVSLFEEIQTVEEEGVLENTVTKLKQKYGNTIIKKANLIERKTSKKYNE
ncbi:MAG: DNA polymerase IV [Bacilli bacterium]|nr:DNA polymerase IV [Bacilli bacterium]